MKTHLSAAEIAALKLPGLPATKRGVLFAAHRGEWASRARTGPGGGLEYSIDSLPEAARIAYVGRHAEIVDLPAPVAEEAASEPAAAKLTGCAAEGRDARLALLVLADELAATAKLSRKAADRHFSDLYNAGTINAAAWIRRKVKSIGPRTLARWRALARNGEKTKLGVDRAAARRGTGVLERANDGEVKTYILALIIKQPQLTAHHIHKLVADRFPALAIGACTVALPPVRTLQRVLKQWRATYRVDIEAIRHPDGFKSTMRFAARVSAPAVRLNEVWQIDASPADILTTDGRYTLYVCVDVYSRRLIALVTKTPRAAAVGLLIRKAILAWGVPERIKTDNGSDFVARATRRLFAALGIEHEKSAPFSPEQKGHVERAIGTLQRGLMRTLEGFIGHSVPDRKVIENRKAFSARLGETPEDMFAVSLSAADLQMRVDNWCRDVYGTKAHAGLKGQTPFAVAAMAAGRVRRIEDVRALDILLAPIAGKDGLRTATKSGLRIGGAHYIAGWLTVGETVLVRMDEHDMGRAYVFSPDGEDYLGEAVAPELAGVDPAAAISAARAAQKRLINERMDEVRKVARKIRAGDFADAIRRQALKDAGTLIEFPKPTDNHETPALAAASKVGAPIEPQYSDAVVELAKKLQAEDIALPTNVTPLRLTESQLQFQRWNRAREIEARVARGEFVDTEDLMWLGGYREGPEYRGFLLTYGEADLVSTQQRT